jgi:hypothetical protein
MVRFDRSVRRMMVLGALLTAVGVSSLPETARADWQGCTGVDSGMSCLKRYGKKLYVDKLVMSRWKEPSFIGPYPVPPYICNYQAGFPVLKDGKRIWLQWSSKHVGCMRTVRVTRTTHVNGSFPKGAKVCGDWYENDTKLGTVCEAPLKG